MKLDLFSLNSCLILIIMLMINGCSSRKTPAPVVDVQGSLPLSQRYKNSVKGSEYIVKKGETLYSIAWRADLDVRTLASINGIKAPYKIFPDQKLLLNQKPRKPSKNSTFKPIKHKVTNRPLVKKKKQEYGERVERKKQDVAVRKNTVQPKFTFSQKIKKWRWPAQGKVIQKFSTAKQGNKGINIAGQRGDPIKATANGKVVYAGDALQGYGQLIIIKHNDDYLSAYAHNNSILVKEQQVVKSGQVIAKMGDTDAERVMLHFEVRFRGKSVNPMKYLPK